MKKIKDTMAAVAVLVVVSIAIAGEGRGAMKIQEEASTKSLFVKHFAALNELDPEKRKVLVTEVYDPHVKLIDPYVVAEGHAAFEKLCDEIHKHSPGFVFRVVDDIDIHHECARIHWELLKPGASATQTGDDIVKIKDGRIVEILVFFNALAKQAPDRK